MSFVSRPLEIVTFHRKIWETPNWVVDFQSGKDTFRKMEIVEDFVEDFVEKSYNNNDKHWNFFLILRVKSKTLNINDDFVFFHFFTSSFFHFFRVFIFSSFFHF